MVTILAALALITSDPSPMAPNLFSATHPVLSSPPPAVLTVKTLPAPWGCIAFYESTDRPDAYNPSSGAAGYFGIEPATWAEYAPPGYPPSPLSADLVQQYTVAKAVLAGQGWRAWETASLCGVG